MLTRRTYTHFSGSLSTDSAQQNGGGTQYIAQSPISDVVVVAFISNTSDPYYARSVDGGLSWTAPTFLKAATITQLACWYDRDSAISDNLLHFVYTDSVSGDVFYRNLNIETDALSAETTVFNGASTAASTGMLSITRTRGGNLICAGTIDDGTESFCKKSTDVGANWSDIASPCEGETGDKLILLPGWAADNQDTICIFWDANANEISRKVYDDSANSWAETSIMAAVDPTITTYGFPHFAAVADHARQKHVVIAWTAVDTLNADLLAWDVDEAAITALGDVVTNSTDDQSLAALCLDTLTGRLWALYAGKTNGSETAPTALNIYCKSSIDNGATWGAETEVMGPPLNTLFLCSTMHSQGPALFWSVRTSRYYVSVPVERYSVLGSPFIRRETTMHEIKLADTDYIPFSTCAPSTGEAVDADSTPVATVYEDGSAMAYAPTVTNLDTGLYHVVLVASSANGFEAGKRYGVAIEATVAGRVARASLGNFLCVARYPDDIGVPLDEIWAIHGLDIANPLEVNITGGTRVAGAIEQTIGEAGGTTTVQRT